MTTLPALRAAFDRVPGYLDAATNGLPARATVAALRDALDEWSAGTATTAGYDVAVARARAAYATIVGTPVTDVAIGSQASALVGTVAASLPDGARVLTVDGDFTSVVYPFLVQADRGVQVRHVPAERLVDEIVPGTDVVAFSLAQSRDGRVTDLAEVAAAARSVGALTVCDVTQATGWMPVDATLADVTVCAAYKWLAAPRGVAFLTVGPAARERLRPVAAGWYAGADVWRSVYGPTMRLADDARRFDVSPAWLCWAGAAPALELFAAADPHEVRAHDVGLADALRARLDLPPAGRAVVTLPDDEHGTLRARLEAAGCRVAGRGGGVRLAFHVWNDADDVELAADALADAGALVGSARRSGD
ncbi:aminotransferase class V-fold PLP-dependent enzyme [Cellulomonas composti]|uniref:Aminotransferase class V n=1 Tax=Cellulomonas composti TaxID=266130 RepID=A0A511J871_9CELL|nr:aminotransferase class V-fold PLP-dependent enzyme [Cellulomonas composti]GEL93919.1 aminotransferase class V [Cellulomonas composti]